MPKSGKSTTLTEITMQKIISMIVDENLYHPGDKLPNEEEFSKELGVSRVTLRAALGNLVAQGVIERSRGVGTFVSEGTHLVSGEAIDNLMTICPKISRELLEMRLICEPNAAYYAALRATDKEIKKIKQYRDEIKDCVKNNKPRTIPEQNFHIAIASATHNVYMKKLIPILVQSISEVIEILDESTIIRKVSIEDHELVVNQIENHNPRAAKAAMEIHLLRAIEVTGFEIE